MKDRWTDDRLDDLNDKVGDLGRRMDNGFNRVDADIRGLRGEVGATRTELRGEIADLRGEMNARFDAMKDRFDSRFDLLQDRLEAMQRLMLQFGGALVAALIGVIATLIATQV